MMGKIIAEFQQKFKKIIYTLEKPDVFVVIIIILVGLSSFGLGRLSAGEDSRKKISIEYSQEASVAAIDNESRQIMPQEEKYVASKNGSAYHFPWCSGAQRILDKNKIWFESKEEAESAGYRPAGNCKGIE